MKLLKIDDKPNDSLNIRFWNLVFTLFFVTIFVLIIDQINGTKYFLESLNVSFRFFWWISLSMSVTFFSYVFFIRALGIGKASVTQAVKATTIIFAIPVTFLLSYFIPVSTPPTPVLWLIKGMGIILVVLGIVSFALTQVKAYVFIRAQPGVKISSLLQEVWKVRGVDSVSAVSGGYDLVAKVRIRTLLKGYEMIIRRLEAIPGIKEFKWSSILKEWENI
ncbi:MAG TPA: Lrp/AsnC family transcriptional regulator [Thermoplasmata archaeon]|nr:Lrp/AsnC family transcriptional regulator [Thermoplasmata archaeon]